jgi:uncharacterized protein (DUF362 family)/NAD-dependent dihydropyrimidine dehydrogenase PreA subunit
VKRFSAVKIDKYEIKELKIAMLKGFDEIGGVDRYIKSGMKIALKPNLVMKKNSEAAATTNPAILEALGEIIKERSAKAILIESPGGPFLKSRLKSIYDGTGMTEVCERTGIEMNFELDQMNVKNDEGRFLKTVTIIKAFENVDAIINLPKLKTHGQMVYTGAVKNMFGAVPGVIKAEHHFRMPDYDDFANSIIDIFLAVKPKLNLLDAIDAMEGHGPSGGDVKKLGFIMLSEDAFILDYAACRIIGLEHDEVPMLRQAVKRGYLKPELAKEEFEDIKELICKDFKIPSRDNPRLVDFSDHTPSGRFIKLLKPKPVFDHNKCVLCGECVRSCPAKVLSIKDKRIRVDLEDCIRCYCCQELCPEKAVEIKRGFLIETALKIDRAFNRRKK